MHNPAESDGHFEWQLAAGAWSLAPFTSPVTKASTRLVRDEVDYLIAPFLFEFAFFTFQPHIQLNSDRYFFAASAWFKLFAEKLAFNVSAGYLNFTLPFLLTAEQDIYLFNKPIAQLRKENIAIPAFIVSPTLAVSMYYWLAKKPDCL